MSRTLFVLGAGASAHSGTPLMNNFLEIAQGLWRRGEVEEAKEDFKRVFDAVAFLQSVRSYARLDTFNIEIVYAAFEMGKTLDRFPGFEQIALEGGTPTIRPQMDQLISSLKKVIGYTLERTTKLFHDAKDVVSPPHAYGMFVEQVRQLMTDQRAVSIITFNYDLGLDYALYRSNILMDYALSDINPRGMYLPYLKLHGSLNWRQCIKCQQVTSNQQFNDPYSTNKDYSTIPAIAHLRKMTCSKCGERAAGEDPFIVPPTWNKTAYHTSIERVWKRAAIELSDAENVIVLGYSLPSTDLFFNYLFALGIGPRTFVKRFYVYNPDDSLNVQQRFRDLLGSGVIERFKYNRTSFEAAVDTGQLRNVIHEIIKAG